MAATGRAEPRRRADDKARRPRVRRLVADQRLARQLAKRLKKKHSPERDTRTGCVSSIPMTHTGGSPTRRVSQMPYLQGGGGLEAELIEALRTGRTRRRREGPNPGRGARGKLKDVVLISERPAETEDRAMPGHWEGNLLLGRAGKS